MRESEMWIHFACAGLIYHHPEIACNMADRMVEEWKKRFEEKKPEPKIPASLTNSGVIK